MISFEFIFEIIFGIILFFMFIYFISAYNKLVGLKNNIKRSWSDIDVILKQRYDELNNLIESIKGYMNYERDLLTKLTQARSSFISAKTINQKAFANNLMTSAIKSIFAVAENYPQLKANENFLQLQNRISVLENQLADKREFYNDSVNEFNIKIQQFPTNIIAKIFHFSKADLFEFNKKMDFNVRI